MKQISLTIFGFELVTKRTRNRVFLNEMNLVVPRTKLIDLIQHYAPSGAGAKFGRPAFALEALLHIHFLQQCFGLSDLAIEESRHDTQLYCEFARLDPGATRLPDESTILRFRHLLEANNLSLQIIAVINAKLIAARSSTKNSSGERDPAMHQTKKDNKWHFGMKPHLGLGVDSSLVHFVIGTKANVNDVSQSHGLLNGQKYVNFAYAGYQGAAKRPEATGVERPIALRPGKHRALFKNSSWSNLLFQAEQLKASIRGRVKHPFIVLKCQFGFTKVLYRRLVKNTAKLVTQFALSNLWVVINRITQGAPWISALAKQAIAYQISKKSPHPSQYAQNFSEIAFCDLLSNCLTANSGFSRG